MTGLTTRLSRLGLLAAALALPLTAVVASYVSGADPGPDVPVEVRVGGPGADPVLAVPLVPAPPPLPEAARIPVVVEQPAEIWTGSERVRPRSAPAGSVSETVVTAPPPVVVDGAQPSPAKGSAKTKDKTKSTPPGRGRAAAGNG